MLEARNIQKSFGPVDAVRSISFDVKQGEVVGLLGPNGAGKTTTMRLVTGYLDPDAGDITINGISLRKQPIEARRQIGYLPENAPLYHEMEVAEFLNYTGYLQGVAANELPERVREMIELCRLRDVVGRPIGELSRGYKQRVSLAQALISKPPLLILDEPTTGLDPHQIQEIRQLIRDIGRERTVILSSHIMQEVEAVCSRAIIISHGSIVGEGTVEDLMKASRTGQKGGKFAVKIKATRPAIESKISALAGFSLEQWRSEGEVILRANQANVDGSDIFNWVVNNQWVLTELRSEGASMEDVFLELTK